MNKPITAFTTIIPFWKPRVRPVDLESATDDQLQSMRTTPSSKGISEYVLVLAHDPETLEHRTPLFNGIMYSQGGLPRSDTEICAVAASVINRCIYCAAVHSSRYNEITKTESVMDKILYGCDVTDLTKRQVAILNFAKNLSKCPSEAQVSDLQQLIEVGLTKLEILDLILSTSLFGWANRLMHTLGDPMLSETS